MNFESWRDFSLEGEHDVEDAHDRYEKRWMIKENDRKSKVCARSLASFVVVVVGVPEHATTLMTWLGCIPCSVKVEVTSPTPRRAGLSDLNSRIEFINKRGTLTLCIVF